MTSETETVRARPRKRPVRQGQVGRAGDRSQRYARAGSVIAAGLLVGAAVIVGMALRHTSTSGIEAEQPPGAVIVPDYQQFRSLSELLGSSDVVVLARSVAVGPGITTRVGGAPSRSEAAAAGKPHAGTFVTHLETFQISRVLRGEVSAGDELTVRTLGGSSPEGLFSVEGWTPTTPGQSYLLFLGPGGAGRALSYVGGTQGRYVIEQGRVRATTTDSPSPVERLLGGRDRSAMPGLIATAMAEQQPVLPATEGPRGAPGPPIASTPPTLPDGRVKPPAPPP